MKRFSIAAQEQAGKPLGCPYFAPSQVLQSAIRVLCPALLHSAFRISNGPSFLSCLNALFFKPEILFQDEFIVLPHQGRGAVDLSRGLG